MKCSNTGLSCTNDGQCGTGKCLTGSFTSPVGPGLACFASWPSCDANVILKVRPDRVCNKWLTCKTSLPVTDAAGQTTNQCFHLTICDSLSPSGECTNLLEGRQCDNDPLRFCTSDADCLAGGRCNPSNSPEPLTFSSPASLSSLKYLTGYAEAGLRWPISKIHHRSARILMVNRRG